MASIPSIVIDQQYGALGIEMTQAQMKITMPKLAMEVERQDPEFDVESQRPEFKLNWKKVYAESGLTRPKDFSKKVKTAGLNKVAKGTYDSVKDGDYLAKVQNPGNRVAQLARQETIKTQQAEINLSSMPRSTPEVEWTPGSVNINWTRGALSIDWVGDYMPEVVIDPPFSIEIFLREKPYIKIMVEDGTAPVGAGTLIDQHL